MELSITELEKLRLERDIAETLERDRVAYQDRKWLQSERADKEKPMTPYQKMKQERRGSRPGVKRGKYKVRGDEPRKLTKLATSKYYSQNQA